MKFRNASLKSSLRPGRVYRRQELGERSTSIDRELQELVRSGLLKMAFTTAPGSPVSANGRLIIKP